MSQLCPHFYAHLSLFAAGGCIAHLISHTESTSHSGIGPSLAALRRYTALSPLSLSLSSVTIFLLSPRPKDAIYYSIGHALYSNSRRGREGKDRKKEYTDTSSRMYHAGIMQKQWDRDPILRPLLCERRTMNVVVQGARSIDSLPSNPLFGIRCGQFLPPS